MCLGDKPELAFKEYRETLARLGARSTIDYVARACEVALDEGLLPHTNAGIMSLDEMAMLRPLNVSMGLMLENVSTRLRGRGEVHQWAPGQGSCGADADDRRRPASCESRSPPEFCSGSARRRPSARRA